MNWRRRYAHGVEHSHPLPEKHYLSILEHYATHHPDETINFSHQGPQAIAAIKDFLKPHGFVLDANNCATMKNLYETALSFGTNFLSNDTIDMLHRDHLHDHKNSFAGLAGYHLHHHSIETDEQVPATIESMEPRALAIASLSVDWRRRYAMERTAIALKDNEQRLHPDALKTLKEVGKVINGEHLVFGQQPDVGRGDVTETDPQKWRPQNFFSELSDKNVENAIRPQLGTLRLHPKSIPAFKKVQDTVYGILKGSDHQGYPMDKDHKNPHGIKAVFDLVRSIKDQVGGRKDTSFSDAGGGAHQALHYTIENSPSTQTELHRGITIPHSMDVNKEFTEGSEHQFGVQSWSANEDIAKAFAFRTRTHAPDNPSAIFHLPRGVKALQVGGIVSGSPQSQHEYLSAYGTYRVKKHEVIDGVHHIHFEQTGLSEDARQALADKGDQSVRTQAEREMYEAQEPMRRHWDNVDRDTTITPSSIRSTTQQVKKWRGKNPGKIGPSSEELWKQISEGIPR